MLENVKEVEKIADKDGRMKQILKHVVDTVFDIENVPMPGNAYEINGVVPLEGLQTFGTWEYESLILTNSYMIGIENKHKTDKNKFKKLPCMTCHPIMRQSERDLPIPMGRSRITSGTKRGGSVQKTNSTHYCNVYYMRMKSVVIKLQFVTITEMAKMTITLLHYKKWCHSNNNPWSKEIQK